MANIRPFCMPKWGIEMTEGTLAEWMIKEGDAFTKGQTLCLIETSKITNEVEAEYDAVLARVLVHAGGEAQPVGALLGVVADAGTDAAEIDAFIASFVPVGGPAPAAAPPPPPVSPEVKPAPRIVTNRAISPEALKLAEAHGVDIEPIEGSGRNGRITYQDVAQAMRPAATLVAKGALPLVAEVAAIFASPLAQRIAAQHGIDLAPITGTGPRGRICKADVLALVADKTAPGAAPGAATVAAGAPFALVDNPPRIEPFAKIRKVVARRLTEAKQQVPHFYLRIGVGVDALLALRKTANLVLGTRATINDYLVKAVGLALARHPDVNVQVHGEEIHHFPHADVAIAVASPKGLVTPIVRQADRLPIDKIAQATRDLIDRANAGKLTYQDMDGGTFSISNLGMFGIEQFDAIINPPQGAILAVGGINRAAVEGAHGQVAFESRMTLTMSVDHRAIDGAGGAQFLATLKGLIENPEDLFAR